MFNSVNRFLRIFLGSLEEAIFNAKKNMNIVFLGETGNGKSTLINSFFNILMNDTWECALESKTLYVPICTKYVMRVENEDCQATISLGKDHNLNPDYAAGNASASATRLPMSHILKCQSGKEKIVITLVDTPGVKATEANRGNDTSEHDSSILRKVIEKEPFPSEYSVTRKMKQTLVTNKDEEIVTAIFNHVSHLQHIDAFVIVMKAHQEKLSLNLETTLKAIFNQLTKSSKKNIILAITMDCDFDDMSTIEAFKKFVHRENLGIEWKIFRFDNKPFRYLGVKCTQHTTHFSMQTMQWRWEESKTNYKNLIEYISLLDANNTQIIKSVNTTKQLIKVVTDPLINICKVGEENLNSLDKAYKETADATGRRLIPIQEKYLTFKKLKNPYSVCTNEMCYKQVKYKEDNQMVDRNLYTSICCNDCIVPFTTHEVKGCRMLYFCRSINLYGICKKCEHESSEHMHIAYELDEAERTLNMEGSLNLKQKKEQYLIEIEIVTDALAYFSQYLDHHSLYEIGFVDQVFKKQIDEINSSLARQAKDIKDKEDELKTENTTGKDNTFFLKKCINGCMKEINSWDKDIAQTNQKIELEKEDKKKKKEERKSKQVFINIRGVNYSKEDLVLKELLLKKEKKEKEMANYNKKLHRLEDLNVKNKVTKMLERGMNGLKIRYKEKIEQKPFDNTSHDCVRKIENLCEMEPHGPEFKKLYQSIANACESKEFYLERTYHIGTNNNADIPQETLKINPTEN